MAVFKLNKLKILINSPLLVHFWSRTRITSLFLKELYIVSIQYHIGVSPKIPFLKRNAYNRFSFINYENKIIILDLSKLFSWSSFGIQLKISKLCKIIRDVNYNDYYFQIYFLVFKTIGWLLVLFLIIPHVLVKV